VIGNTNGTNGDFWNVSNNHIYQPAIRFAQMVGVFLASGNGNIISNNSIGGSGVGRTGVAMQTTNGIVMGISSAGGSVALPTIISNNLISNIAGLAITGSAVNAINIGAGYANITNNIIGGGALPSDTIQTGPDNGGINVNGGVVLIENNVIGNIRNYTLNAQRTAGIAVNPSTAGSIVRNNIIRDIAGSSISVTGASVPTGIYVSNAVNALIEQNTITNISNINPNFGPYIAAGISVASGSALSITRNRISKVSALSTGTGINAPQVAGIYNAASTAGHMFSNNQISVGKKPIQIIKYTVSGMQIRILLIILTTRFL
jgi:hypothetical protein